MRARGIFILGLNGCGKTTLGRALAERLGRLRLDVEDYYFPDMTVPYAHPRSRDAVCRLMIEDISTHGDFVLSSVDADLTCELRKLCRLAVWLRAPRELRLARIATNPIGAGITNSATAQTKTKLTYKKSPTAFFSCPNRSNRLGGCIG